MKTSKVTEKNKKAQKNTLNKTQKVNAEKQGSPKKSLDKEDKNSKSGCGTAILIVIIIFLIFSCSNGKDKDSEPQKSTAQVETTEQEENTDQTEVEEPIEAETDSYGWTSHDYTWFRTVTKLITDNYVTNYKVPFYENWSYAKFDETGKIFVTTKYSFENMNEKQPVICVFSLGEDVDGDGYSDSYTAHFLSIGNNIYVDDGSCDEFFQNLQSITDSSNG